MSQYYHSNRTKNLIKAYEKKIEAKVMSIWET